ncbi:hypothetical protein XELAEV_18021096mg [Xenopus laevis]|uniref:Uncharacterized protein n=1 Tax=Xenopus laevis TaxID=8355 RepID=A0A974DAT9_XENLA|nr:hypothetical protein XELAEV_18021096mg [Xenopus laevis]
MFFILHVAVHFVVGTVYMPLLVKKFNRLVTKCFAILYKLFSYWQNINEHQDIQFRLIPHQEMYRYICATVDNKSHGKTM